MSHNDKILIIKHVFIAVWSISRLGPFCWRVLSDCAITWGNLSTTWYDLTPTGQRGNFYEKKYSLHLIFTFYLSTDIRVSSTLKSAWILTLVLYSAWIWSKPWKLLKILEKCLNYSIPSLNFFSCWINEISHSVFCIVIIYVEMSITLCFFAELIFFWFSFNLVRRATG